MKKERLFEFLEQQESSVLIDLLDLAYDVMNTNQRLEVFGSLEIETLPSQINEEDLLEDIKIFSETSLGGDYYSPFEINSKNFMNLPEETSEWFEELGNFLKDTTQVSEKGNHPLAVECFNLLYKLIERMEKGEEIVFGDEIGSWMIPGEEKIFIKAYIHSSSVISTPKEFLKIVLPLIQRDSYQSLANQVYDCAIQLANQEQKSLLSSEIQRKKIRIKRKY